MSGRQVGRGEFTRGEGIRVAGEQAVEVADHAPGGVEPEQPVGFDFPNAGHLGPEAGERRPLRPLQVADTHPHGGGRPVRVGRLVGDHQRVLVEQPVGGRRDRGGDRVARVGIERNDDDDRVTT